MGKPLHSDQDLARIALDLEKAGTAPIEPLILLLHDMCLEFGTANTVKLVEEPVYQAIAPMSQATDPQARHLEESRRGEQFEARMESANMVHAMDFLAQFAPRAPRTSRGHRMTKLKPTK